MHDDSSADAAEQAVAEAARTRPWQPYLEASLGFRNHWYPALFSAELAEGGCLGRELLGERLLFKRVSGAVYAVQDRCLHRGVPFSTKPESYTANTVTCWYHGFTYDVRDGRLVAVVTDPECALIGKLALRTYPIQEQQGIVFVFVGDRDPPPPLHEDVQPGLLDADLALYPRGEVQVVRSNWRLAAENGFDAAHIYIHRDSRLVTTTRTTLPLATLLTSREGMVVAAPGAPKGVVKGSGRRIPIWETTIEGTRVAARFQPGTAPPRASPDTSMWLPCGLKVDPFPAPGIIQFEWYVPIDERSHRYLVTWGKRVAAPADADAFYAEIDAVWRDLVIDGFNNDDVAAREAMDRFYAEEDGWERERLYRPDVIITEWRKLASAHHRGIQRRGSIQ
jgi:carbazole 1,9a-dioxygenase terminal dioxygenase component